MPTNGQQKAIQRCFRVSSRSALVVSRPRVRNRFATLQGITHLSARHYTHRHIKQEGRTTWVWHTKTKRTITKPRVAAAPRRNRRGRVTTDHAGKAFFGCKQGVGRDRPKMITAPRKRHPNATLTRRIHRCTQRMHTDQRPHTIVTIYQP